jgi:hypothetical protein
MTPMATCASAAGGSIFAAAAAVAKRSVLVCKNVLFCAKMAVYTVRITGWALKRKS